MCRILQAPPSLARTPTATKVNTNVTNQFTTNSAGDYVFVDMIPGTYEVKVEASGFKTEVSAGLVLGSCALKCGGQIRS